MTSISLEPDKKKMAGEGFLAVLETDLRLLSSEARRPDSFAGQLSGWLSGSEHPEVKEAAERAVLKLRSLSSKPDALEALRANKVLYLESLIRQIPRDCTKCSVELATIQPAQSTRRVLNAPTISLQEILKPFLLACESKNSKLASISLVCMQKMLANNGVSGEGRDVIVEALVQVQSF